MTLSLPLVSTPDLMELCNCYIAHNLFALAQFGCGYSFIVITLKILVIRKYDSKTAHKLFLCMQIIFISAAQTPINLGASYIFTLLRRLYLLMFLAAF